MEVHSEVLCKCILFAIRDCHHDVYRKMIVDSAFTQFLWKRTLQICLPKCPQKARLNDLGRTKTHSVRSSANQCDCGAEKNTVS